MSYLTDNFSPPSNGGHDPTGISEQSPLSVHAPARIDSRDERHVVERLQEIAARGWPLVAHPDSIHEPSLWKGLGQLVCIETMDRRKPIERTCDDVPHPSRVR
jgi:hypothetical protein